MKTRSLGPVPLALTLLTIATLIGCSLFGTSDPIAELREYVNGEVEDPDRRARMLVEVEQFDRRIREFAATTNRLGAEMRAANRDYDSSDEAITALFDKHNAARIEARDHILGVLLRFRGLATPAEWKDIMDAQIGEYRDRVAVSVMTSK